MNSKILILIIIVISLCIPQVLATCKGEYNWEQTNDPTGNDCCTNRLKVVYCDAEARFAYGCELNETIYVCVPTQTIILLDGVSD